VEAGELVTLPDRESIAVAALLGHDGAYAPRREAVAVPPQPEAGLIAMIVTSGVGDYRTGDEIWLRRLAPGDLASALNRDVLLPRPAGRFLFGRLIGREDDKLHLLPLGSGQRQSVIANPPWAAVAVRLIRTL
jgi:hypothetical protein